MAQEDEERQQLRSNWELAAVFSFLEAFGPHLRLPSTFTANELERALIISTGQAGLLAELHQVIRVSAWVQQSLSNSGGCPLWARGQQGASPRCMPVSTKIVQKCRGQPPAVFEQAGPKGPAP